MANKSLAAAEPKETSTDSDVKLAVDAVCAITGCGRLDGESRVGRMGPAKIQKIAQFERDNNRAEICTILYT